MTITKCGVDNNIASTSMATGPRVNRIRPEGARDWNELLKPRALQ
ncbi:MAG: hypothetical protein OXF56_26875 [Rhodobacteraceae bacterium]|nr:hypothetical protein [Paracoccaceae bacterium]